MLTELGELARAPKTSTGPLPAPSSGEPVRTASRGDARCAAGRVLEALAAREERGQRCRVRAARAVRRLVAVSARPRSGRAARRRRASRRGSRAVPAGDDDRRRAERVNRLGECRPVGVLARTATPASAQASARFGVTTVASGNRRSTSAATASSRSSRAPDAATITGSTTSGTSVLRRGSRRRSRSTGAREEHPGLRGVDADVVEDRLELRADELGRELVDRA